MTNPPRGSISRTEQWMRRHEEWPIPNDDLRAKVLRTACSAQVQAKEQQRSRTILVMCMLFCTLVTWFMQDIARGLEHPQSSVLLAVSDDGWMRPIDLQVQVLLGGNSGHPYDWSLVQAHLTWRRVVYQKLARMLW